MHAFILAALISHGWARHLAASVFLRPSRCTKCSTGDVTVEMYTGGEQTTIQSMLWECDRCGFERIDFKPPLSESDARMLAAGRMAFQDDPDDPRGRRIN